jgi:hypothetical protein
VRQGKRLPVQMHISYACPYLRFFSLSPRDSSSNPSGHSLVFLFAITSSKVPREDSFKNMDLEPMEIDDAGNPIVVSLPLESSDDTSGTELNDSDNTSMTSNFCPHCSRSLSPFSQSGSRTHPESLTVGHVDWSDLRTNLNNALLNKFDRGSYVIIEALLLT